MLEASPTPETPFDPTAHQPNGGLIEPLYFHLTVSDPEVAAAVADYPVGPQRVEFINACLKVGVLAIRTARGVIDGEAIRRESDNLILRLTERLESHKDGVERDVSTSLKHYFDPASGLFMERVARLVKDDGELATVIKHQVESVQARLVQTFEQFVGQSSPLLTLLGPGESNALLAAMKDTVDRVLKAESAAIQQQFSLDKPDSALSRLTRELTKTHGDLTHALKSNMEEVVAEFSLDKADSALSRLVGRVETAHTSITKEFSLDNEDSALYRLSRELNTKLAEHAANQQSFQSQVLGILQAMQIRKEEAARSTLHGAEYEVAVGERLRSFCVPAGDVLEDCGTMAGAIPRSKVGDFVVTLSPDCHAAGARIVIEAKESGSYTVKKTVEEAEEARRNRNASICIFVHSARTAPAAIDTLCRHGNDVLCVWDADDERSDIVLKAAYFMGKAMAIRAAQRSKAEAANYLAIDTAIETIRKQFDGFTEIRTSSNTIRSSAEKIENRARIMSEALTKQLAILEEQMGAIKGASDTP